MKKNQIHPTAIVEEGAIVEDDVQIGAYAIVGPNVTLKSGANIMSHAFIDGYTTVGENTTIFPFASIGTKPQDLKFKGEKTFVSIGKNTEIREFVTINASCKEGTTVKVGDSCLIMAYCHIAHNCEVGNHVIMSNNSALAGYVEIGDNAFISGYSAVHQFTRIGTFAMVGGMSAIGQDILPYTIGRGNPFKLGGLNLVGLKRNNFPLETRIELSKAFRILYASKLDLNEALVRIREEVKLIPEVQHWLDFIAGTKRGLICMQGVKTFDGHYTLLEDRCEVENPEQVLIEV